MCGRTKISGMKRRRKNGARRGRKSYRRRGARMGALPTVSNLTGAVMQGATVVAGYGLAGVLQNNIGFLSTNPLIGNLAQIVAGVITPTILKGNVGAGLGIGMVAKGVQGLVVNNVPGIANTLGLAGIPEMSPYYSVVGGFNDPGPMNSIAGGSDNIMLKMR